MCSVYDSAPQFQNEMLQCTSPPSSIPPPDPLLYASPPSSIPPHDPIFYTSPESYESQQIPSSYEPIFPQQLEMQPQYLPVPTLQEAHLQRTYPSGNWTCQPPQQQNRYRREHRPSPYPTSKPPTPSSNPSYYPWEQAYRISRSAMEQHFLQPIASPVVEGHCFYPIQSTQSNFPTHATEFSNNYSPHTPIASSVQHPVPDSSTHPTYLPDSSTHPTICDQTPPPLTPIQTNGGRKTRTKPLRRTEFSATDLKTLEQHFSVSDFARGARRDEIARQLNVRPRSVTIWFQNKRAKLRARSQQINLLKKAAETGQIQDVGKLADFR